MTATDRLRAMLDERGVDWGNVRQNGTLSEYFTEWRLDGTQDYVAADEALFGDGLTVKITRRHCTPEQAIAATLGAGTCRSTTDDSTWCFVCSECGKSFPQSDLHFAHNHGEINYCPNCGRRVER